MEGIGWSADDDPICVIERMGCTMATSLRTHRVDGELAVCGPKM